MRLSRFRIVVVAAVPGLLFGCGGGEQPKSPPPEAAPPPAAQVRRQEPARRVPAGPKPQDEEPSKGKQQTGLVWPEGIPAEKVYMAFVTPRSNFDIGEASGGPHPDDWHVALHPQEGADSRSFRATPPDWAAEQRTRAAGFRLPEGFTAIESEGYANDGWPRRIRCETDGSVMAYVPGGAFIQGMDHVDENAGPSRPADVDPFYIDVTEVTVGQYRRFLEQGADTAVRPPQPPVNADSPDDHPALGMQWGDAQAYVRWAGKALPTESEWELAARGPRSFVHPWGNGRAVWERRRVPGQIDPVGSFRSDESVFGVKDVAGNAREWVADFYHPQAYRQASADGSVVRNWTGPKRPSPANHKVVKGGGANWELWHRGSASMRSPGDDVSFRCVLRFREDGDAPEPAAAPRQRRRSN